MCSKCAPSFGVLRDPTASTGAPRGFGDLGRMALIFREPGSTGNYFRGAREQAHNFGDIGSHAKKQKQNKEKPPFGLIFLKNVFCFWGASTPPPEPPCKL